MAKSFTKKEKEAVEDVLTMNFDGLHIYNPANGYFLSYDFGGYKITTHSSPYHGKEYKSLSNALVQFLKDE